MDDEVRLRPFVEDDLEMLTRFATEPAFSEPFEWEGFKSPEAFRRRWQEDAFLERDPHHLVVSGADGAALGFVMWRDPDLCGRHGWAWEIGIVLAPEHRGRGVGRAAQRLLVEYLFTTTATHRLTANTELDNVAEQHALEACGFRREGVLRRAGLRGGEWRDVVVYGLLREDLAG